MVLTDAGLAAAGTPWSRRARWITKPAVVPALALAVGGPPAGRAAAPAPGGTVAGRAGGPPGARAVQVALAGSWVGDVALLSESDGGFLGGVGGFAAAHVAYLTAVRRFTSAPGSRRRDTAVTAAYGAVLAATGGVLWRHLDGPAERRLRGPVLGYAALVTGLGAATARAGLRHGGPAGRALAAGGAVFVLSDGLVALSHFGGRRRPLVDAAVMLTYAGAQALLLRALTSRSADQDDLEGARPVHALDPVQLDVAGRGRSADPGERAARV